MRDETDACLAAAFQDVPVPEGLAERLLSRLAADAAEGGVSRLAGMGGGADIFVCTSADKNVFPTGQFASYSRRWLLVGGGLLAAAAGVVLAVWLGTHSETRLSEQIVLDEAIQSFDAGSKDSGRLLSDAPAPAEYPLSRMVRHAGAAKWRPVDGFLGRGGVVYDLSRPGGGHAALYVVNREVEGLRTAPRLHPFTTAGSNCCASAWQERQLLYVLVVQGDRTTYESYLKLPRNPVAQASRGRVQGSGFPS